MPQPFAFLAVQGSRYEIGCQVGEALRGGIARATEQVRVSQIPEDQAGWHGRRRRLQVCAGNPCAGSYVTYSV